MNPVQTAQQILGNIPATANRAIDWAQVHQLLRTQAEMQQGLGEMIQGAKEGNIAQVIYGKEAADAQKKSGMPIIMFGGEMSEVPGIGAAIRPGIGGATLGTLERAAKGAPVNPESLVRVGGKLVPVKSIQDPKSVLFGQNLQAAKPAANLINNGPRQMILDALAEAVK